MAIRIRHRRNSNNTEAGPGLIVFGVFWTLFSSIFVVIGLSGAINALRSETWLKVPCLVERFEILDDRKEKEAFTAEVRYRYAVDGREFTSTRLHAKEKRYKDYHELAKLQASFLGWDSGNPEPGRFDPAGRAPDSRRGEIHCRVNPDNPEEAVLIADRGSIVGGIVFACFGLGFVGVGVGLIIYGVRGWKAKRAGGTASITRQAGKSGEAPMAILIPFFSVFGVAGFGILFGVVAPMWWGYFAAKSWEEVPAKVIWSRVETNTGSDSTTYMPRIFYRYELNGQEFRSDRHRFSSMSSSGYDGKKAVVDAHPPGASVTCFVNPSAPWEAVLDRRLGAYAWFSLFPLPFILIGVFGLRWAIGQKRKLASGGGTNRKSKSPVRDWDKASNPGVIGQSGPLEFCSGANRRRDVLVALAIALFWNGIVSVFVVEMARGWRAGESPWFLTLFLVPFIGVGLFLLGVFLHNLGGLANPRLLLRVNPAAPRLGESVQLSWQFPNGPDPVERLVIIVSAKEKATYRSGKNTTTAESVFFHEVIHDSADHLVHAEGRATLHLPAGLMHTWSSRSNAIEWEVSVHGKIRMRPDIKDRFPLTVQPASAQ